MREYREGESMSSAKHAIIGYTGFVGSNLVKQFKFDDLYNSSNIHEIANRDYDLVVCCGVKAVKWQANKDPVRDKREIAALISVLETLTVDTFVLISTIDVYPLAIGVDERYDCGQLENHPYGLHRFEFENYVREKFKNCHVIRLPGLFGDGLKKNIIYDLLNDNCLEMINSASCFQYYNLDFLWEDVCTAIDNKLGLVNLVSEPLRTSELIEAWCPSKKVGGAEAPTQLYDLSTQYSSLWNGPDGYILSKQEVLTQILKFMKNYSKGSNS